MPSLRSGLVSEEREGSTAHGTTSDLGADVRGVLLRARVVSAALIGSVVGFAGVATFLIAAGTFSEGAPLPLTGTILLGGFSVAMAAVLAAPVIGAAAGRSARGSSVAQRTRAFFAETVVTQAVREGAGLAGTLIAMLAGNVTWVLSFALLSVAAQAWSWPREEALRKRLRLP